MLLVFHCTCRFSFSFYLSFFYFIKHLSGYYRQTFPLNHFPNRVVVMNYFVLIQFLFVKWKFIFPLKAMLLTIHFSRS